MIETLIFLALGSWAFSASLYAIDLQTDIAELNGKLKLAQEQRDMWEAESAKYAKDANYWHELYNRSVDDAP